jgi:hypothetical protein
VTVPKRLEPVVLIPLEDVVGRRGVITVTTIQTKQQEVLREILANPRIGMLGVISRFVARWVYG